MDARRPPERRWPRPGRGDGGAAGAAADRGDLHQPTGAHGRDRPGDRWAAGLPLRLVDGLGEVKYGEWQGAELKELYKHELWPGVQFYPSGTRFPGGETLGEAQMRMVATLDALRAQHPKGIIAVVSHADIIKLALAYYIGMHMDLFQRLEISPWSVSAI